MAPYVVGFDGQWQEKFTDRDEAITWAEKVAATGRTVEVIRRRFGVYRFVTGFPESEREALEINRRTPYLGNGGAGIT